MNVASKDLSEELFKVSGWEDVEKKYYQHKDSRVSIFTQQEWEDFADEANGIDGDGDFIPAYDAGFMLRKLEVTADWTHGRFILEHYCNNIGEYLWTAKYNTIGLAEPRARNPEDALAELAIELFKQGVLTQEGVNDHEPPTSR